MGCVICFMNIIVCRLYNCEDKMKIMCVIFFLPCFLLRHLSSISDVHCKSKHNILDVLFAAPYVKVYLLENGACIAKKKTRIARKTLDPLYQQTLVFEESPQGKVLQVSFFFNPVLGCHLENHLCVYLNLTSMCKSIPTH